MHIRKARPVALALLAVVPLGLGTTLPANAGSDGTCAAERACLFENRDFNKGYTQHWRDFAGDDYDLRNNYWKDSSGINTNDIMNDETSSVKTNGCAVFLYQHAGYAGAFSYWLQGDSDGDLSNNSIGDNRTSSVEVIC
jgi:hypothetical protein